jgi:hypothetical protein
MIEKPSLNELVDLYMLHKHKKGTYAVLYIGTLNKRCSDHKKVLKFFELTKEDANKYSVVIKQIKKKDIYFLMDIRCGYIEIFVDGVFEI